MDDFNSVFSQTEDVIYLGGFFFLKMDLIRRRDPLVQNVFYELYDYVSDN